nr:alkaline phosphatase family protein [Pelobium sp.]
MKFISKMAFLWLFLMLLSRIFNLVFTNFKNGLPDNFIKLLGLGWLNDSIFWIKTVWLLFLVFIPLFLLSPKFTKLILRIFIILFFLIDLGLSFYFTNALVPLGADVFGYSIADIKQTVGSSGGINSTLMISFGVSLIVLIYVLFFLSEKIKINRFLALLLPLFSLLTISAGLTHIESSLNLSEEFTNNLVHNKSAFFYSESLNHFFPSDDDAILDQINLSEKASFKYVSPTNYPFLHQENTKDILSSFFQKSTQTPPHIVIIIIEGLGRAFSNDGAYLGSFTPFIDSLSKKSLYWKNFLSQGGRTFAVLPSLLGSLPFAKNGYLEMGDKMPPQLSLLNLLKANGYHTSFYYGGESQFDHMDLYLKKNQIDELRDGPSFPQGYQKLPTANGFSWGYDDQSLYKYFLNTRQVSATPQLSVILTVSTHNPFLINQESKYQQAFEARMNSLGFDKDKKVDYRKYKNQYASILYTDDALRSFFNNYQKRADYQNTIFLITGDHRMPEIPMSTKIDRYHVPLIIYSPLLQRTAAMASVSTHADVAPSLLAFLKNSYGIKTPKLSSWLGEGLDTAQNFRNIHHLPLIQTKNNIIDFISRTYHLNNESLFKLDENMDEELVRDDTKKNQLKAAFYQFKKRNQSIIQGKKLLPDSIIQKYSLKLP